MSKKYERYYNFILGAIWFVAAILNVITARNYFTNKRSLASTYICLALVFICIAIMYVSLGIKKRKDRKKDSE